MIKKNVLQIMASEETMHGSFRGRAMLGIPTWFKSVMNTDVGEFWVLDLWYFGSRVLGSTGNDWDRISFNRLNETIKSKCNLINTLGDASGRVVATNNYKESCMVTKKVCNQNLKSLVFGVLLFSLSFVNAQEYKFDFGDGPVASGYVGITSKTGYSDSQGYGIDRGNVSSVTRAGTDALTRDYLTTSDELYFSVAVPQGNYTITVIFGDAEAASSTTVKVENRRLIFDRVTSAPGGILRKSATVRRMETRSIDGSVTMSIKDRELDYRTWDKVLTFAISGTHPAVAGIEIKKNDNAVTMFLCGNSTVVDQITPPWASWGQMFPNFFDSTVAIANYAESGLTSGGFLSMRRLSKLLTEAKTGDYVFVEFGHNDQKNADDVSAYPSNLKKFSDQIKAKGAIPVFVIPTARQGDKDPLTSIGGLAQTMRVTAQSLGVVFIDLNQMVIDLQKALGSDAKQLYMYTAGDGTHFCEFGGYELARSVMKGLEEKFPALKTRFRSNYVSFNPSKPDPINVLETVLPPESGSSSSSVSISSSSSISSVMACGGSPCDVVLQGENFCEADGVDEHANIGFSGAGYLNLDNAAGTKAAYMLETQKGVSQTLYIRYANGSLNPRNMTLSAGSSPAVEISFPSTSSWTNWNSESFALDLPVGKTQVVLASLSAEGGPNIDWIGWTGNQIAVAADCQGSTVTVVSHINQNALQGHFRGNDFVLNQVPAGSYSLVIRNVLGNLVHVSASHGERVVTNASLSGGVYFVEIKQGSRVLGKFKTVKY